jgi:hypothetical protein
MTATVTLPSIVLHSSSDVLYLYNVFSSAVQRLVPEHVLQFRRLEKYDSALYLGRVWVRSRTS